MQLEGWPMLHAEAHTWHAEIVGPTRTLLLSQLAWSEPLDCQNSYLPILPRLELARIYSSPLSCEMWAISPLKLECKLQLARSFRSILLAEWLSGPLRRCLKRFFAGLSTNSRLLLFSRRLHKLTCWLTQVMVPAGWLAVLPIAQAPLTTAFSPFSLLCSRGTHSLPN